MKKIKAVEDKIVIRKLKEDREDVGSVYIPDNIKTTPIEGSVVAVGEKVEGIVAGDHIMFNPGAAIHLKIKEFEYIVVKSTDVFVVIGDVKDGEEVIISGIEDESQDSGSTRNLRRGFRIFGRKK